jgi:hypothetical protein
LERNIYEQRFVKTLEEKFIDLIKNKKLPTAAASTSRPTWKPCAPSNMGAMRATAPQMSSTGGGCRCLESSPGRAPPPQTLRYVAEAVAARRELEGVALPGIAAELAAATKGPRRAVVRAHRRGARRRYGISIVGKSAATAGSSPRKLPRWWIGGRGGEDEEEEPGSIQRRAWEEKRK